MIENLSRQLEIKSQPVRIENKIAEESTAEDPRDSIFARAIRDIWGTLSISTYILIENQRKGMEYFGYSNMIDCLPKEMLSHVTSFLPHKDFNSLVRTNKRTRSRLNNRDRQPLPIELKFAYVYDDEQTKLININTAVGFNTNSEKGRYFEFVLQGPNMSTGSREEQVAALAHWYDAGIQGCLGVPDDNNDMFFCDVREMLFTHLQFLVSNNVIIEKLTLESAHELEVIDLTIFLKENRMRVTQLELTMDVLGDHHMELIHVCRPSSLCIENSFVPSTFHEDPVVRQINELTINSRFVEMKEGSLAAYYRTQSLVIDYIHGATARDIRLILDQWVSSARMDGVIRLYMVIENPEAVGNNILEQVDNQMVEVWDITAQDASDPDKTLFHFRRIADGSQLQFGWSVLGEPNDGVFIACDPSADFSHLQLP